MIASVQVRMARAALGIGSAALAAMAQVARSTVTRFERDEGRFLVETVVAIQSALEKRGIVFLTDGEVRPGGPGIRLKSGRGAVAGRDVALAPVQVRMARAALSLGAAELADELGLASKTILRFERGEGEMMAENASAMRRFFERRDIVFFSEGELRTGGPGVRLKK